jgi:hypothetical protein
MKKTKNNMKKNKKSIKKSIKKKLKNRINMNGGAIDMTTPFNIPATTYPLRNSDADISRYSKIMHQNGFDDHIDIFIVLLQNTTHITFKHLIHSIKNTIIKFEQIIDTEFYLFIPIIGSKPIEHKSNYWISKIFYLLMKKKPISIITLFEELTDEMTNIILCDDAMYSGKQMSENFRSLPASSRDKHIFHILCPFISQVSIKLLDSMKFRKQFYFDELIKPFSDLYDQTIYKSVTLNSMFSINDSRYPIYFDHRVADSQSSFSHLYELGKVCNREKCIFLNSLLQNCKIEGLKKDTTSPGIDPLTLLEQCPPIPYRPGIVKGKDAVRNITPEEFIAEYS